MTTLRKLTQKQENFVLEYFNSGNASDAYRKSYSTENMKVATIKNNAYKLLQNNDILTTLEELKNKAQSAAVMTKQEALERLSSIARTNAGDIAVFGEYVVGKDENGAPVKATTWLLKNSDEMPKNALASIKSVKSTQQGPVFELLDPMTATKQISEMLGWNAPVKTENETNVKNEWHIHPTQAKGENAD